VLSAQGAIPGTQGVQQQRVRLRFYSNVGGLFKTAVNFPGRLRTAHGERPAKNCLAGTGEGLILFRKL